MSTPSTSRRTFLITAASLVGGSLSARDFGPQAPPAGYPDPDIVALDGSFGKYIQGNAPLQRLHTGCLWAEGPAWSGVGNYFLWSDIPNNAQMRWLPEDGHVSVMRNNSYNSNGNTFDTHGRQISAEHSTRSVRRYELNGSTTVLADKYDGKIFNAPNDLVVHPDGGVWFTDPGYGSMGDYEGNKGELLLKPAVYRIDPAGRVEKVTDVEERPNGLCFSPDYKKLYVVDSGSPKNIMSYDVVDNVKLAGAKPLCWMLDELDRDMPGVEQKLKELKTRLFGMPPKNQRRRLSPTAVQENIAEANVQVALQDREELQKQHDQLERDIESWKDRHAGLSKTSTGGKGGSDGVRCDIDGNLWASAGWAGDGYNGVHIFNPEGQRIGQIKLPETGSNLCFGGPKRNRLFITASQSIYTTYVNTRGAHWC